MNDVHVIHPEFPFLARFTSPCFYCLTELVGCSSSHLTVPPMQVLVSELVSSHYTQWKYHQCSQWSLGEIYLTKGRHLL